ncbi:MAG: glycosyltransferase family 4 protein [Aigarchaeota archaeon]|nr:glycosyltransferase family 4 protein [Aigarchaeota archaeon]MDW8092643.1 glycosyltransferase family 4 protein [Nitrososphaerota archaeon]
MGASLAKKDGISRIVSDLSAFLKGRLTIITDRYQPSSTFRVSEESTIIECGMLSLKNDVLKYLLPFIFNTVKMVVLLITMAAKSSATRRDLVLNTHTFKALIVAAIAKIALLRPSNVRLISVIYDLDDFFYFKERFRGIFMLFLLLFLRLNVVDRIVVLDNRVAKSIGEVIRPIGDKKISVIRVGVSPSLLKLAEMNNLSPSQEISQLLRGASGGKIKLFFHAILIPRRRLEDLLYALNLVIKTRKDVILFIGGSLKTDTNYTNYIFHLVDKLSLNEYCVFLDQLSETDLAYMYKTIDIFIFPCANQTWGIAPLEAMVFGKPCIVSTGSGVSEVLTEDLALLVPPFSPEKIAEAVLKLIESEELRNRIGSDARTHVLKSLTFERTVDELVSLFNERVSYSK